MSAILPTNLDDLLYCRGVESERIEFKASWDQKTTGPQVIRTICAFANDYHNLNGGYIAIGVAERAGRAVLPPSGLSAETVELAQRWIRGHCNRLDPVYQPILSPETVAGSPHPGRLGARASDTRPHRVPTDDAQTGSVLGSPWFRDGGCRTTRWCAPRTHRADRPRPLGRPQDAGCPGRRLERVEGSRASAPTYGVGFSTNPTQVLSIDACGSRQRSTTTRSLGTWVFSSSQEIPRAGFGELESKSYNSLPIGPGTSRRNVTSAARWWISFGTA